jgi:hypothetical protein
VSPVSSFVSHSSHSCAWGFELPLLQFRSRSLSATHLRLLLSVVVPGFIRPRSASISLWISMHAPSLPRFQALAPKPFVHQQRFPGFVFLLLFSTFCLGQECFSSELVFRFGEDSCRKKPVLLLSHRIQSSSFPNFSLCSRGEFLVIHGMCSMKCA